MEVGSPLGEIIRRRFAASVGILLRQIIDGNGGFGVGRHIVKGDRREDSGIGRERAVAVIGIKGAYRASLGVSRTARAGHTAG